jgi:hypothetical protein
MPFISIAVAVHKIILNILGLCAYLAFTAVCELLRKSYLTAEGLFKKRVQSISELILKLCKNINISV